MKSAKVISVIAFVIIIFLVGYVAGSINHNEASREIKIGYNNSDNPNRVDYNHIFTDTENQTIIDNFMMIYLHKEKITNVNLDVENPDIYISLMSPRQSVGLIDSRVWFTDEGAIIGERRGESWDRVEYYQIDESDANYIKENIDYQER
jgi:ABC-type oligopeptide transport system substrate-binding subunit